MKMKGIIKSLICLVALTAAFSCQERGGLDVPVNESIVLKLSSGLTKAADTDAESYVNHVDVLIFDTGADGAPAAKVAHERFSVDNSSSVTLKTKRTSFTQGRKYFVYLVANSTFDESVFSGMADYAALMDKKQEDANLHLTALTVSNAPKYFLMDAVAQDEAGNSPVVLYDGNPVNNTILNATLCRAAAKVVVNITANESIQFRQFTMEEGSEGGLYYVRNLPYDTFILAEAKSADEITAKVANTSKGNNAYFTWNPESSPRTVSLVTYAYPHHWDNASILQHETCIIMNLPLVHTSQDAEGNTVETNHYNSWYKIPMTADKKFERNHYYEVNIAINRPGATTESTPVILEDIHYAVEDWTTQTIQVGGEENAPKYLMVNKEEMEMRNISQDLTTLEFASSSPVTVTLKTTVVNGITVPDVYFYDKFNVKTYVGTDITDQMGGVPDEGIAGGITVNSPIPTNNVIRYFTLVVTNEDGISREVTVAQYPLEYITNVHSWYSYRDDFIGSGSSVPTTYENLSSTNNVVGVSYNTSTGRYTYNTSSSGFFRSKVSRSQLTTGYSDIDYYYRGSRGTSYTNAENGNARIYHIRITASSGTYTLGRPKMVTKSDGYSYTDPGEDNKNLVSPSFMIASRLGFINTGTGGITLSDNQTSQDVAAHHCARYVEVYQDPETGEKVVYDDWRLPTEEEINIILKFQGAQNENADAIDFLLNAGYYFSASGPVVNTKASYNNRSSISMRCIRDAY